MRGAAKSRGSFFVAISECWNEGKRRGLSLVPPLAWGPARPGCDLGGWFFRGGGSDFDGLPCASLEKAYVGL